MATPQPEYSEAIKFLQRWNPQGPWIITAIAPLKSGIETASFAAADHVACREWMDEQGSRLKRNLYFTVNAVTRMIDTKPSREHIAGMTWLHVDLDPEAPPDGADPDAHYAAQQARFLALLREPPDGIPAPTLITFSGGGYQAYWKLSRPVLLDGTEEMYEDAKLYNKRLEQLLGGDHCHNVDRIMRVPGSINRPDARKRKKGRREALAEIVEWSDPERVYDLSEFQEAEAATSRAGGSPEVEIDLGSAKPLLDLDAELPSTIPPVVKRIIACGEDPENGEPHRARWSRSEWQHWATCELARRGVNPEVVYSILMDPGWRISDSIFVDSKGASRSPSSAEDYARRQVDRAFAEAEDPELAELNTRHTIALLGGVVRVLTTSQEEVPATGIVAPKTTPTTPNGMELYYANRTKAWLDKDDKEKSMPLWQWWTRHPMSARATSVVFAPEREVEPGVFNLWHGFAVPPAPGDCQPFLDFVHRRMANGRREVYEYVLNWLALTVRRPWEPVGTALVLYSRMTGTGKNAFADLSLGLILGHSFLYVTAEKHLFGQFSGHLATTVALHLGEAATASSAEAEALMKALVTDRTRMSERKGIDGVPVANCLHVLMSSNQDWILRVAPEDRRYCVVDVCEERMPREEYLGLRKHMLAGGAAALHAFLAARDITEFDVVKNRPAGGVAELRQKAHSVEGLDAAWFEFLQSGELPAFCVEREDGSVWLPSSGFLDYLNHTRRPKKLWSPNLLRNLLKGPQENHAGAGMGFEKERRDGARGPWGYVISSLPEARRRWDERRFSYPWDDDGEAGWIVFEEPYSEWPGGAPT